MIWPSAVFNSSSCFHMCVPLLDFEYELPTRHFNAEPLVTWLVRESRYNDHPLTLYETILRGLFSDSHVRLEENFLWFSTKLLHIWERGLLPFVIIVKAGHCQRGPASLPFLTFANLFPTPLSSITVPKAFISPCTYHDWKLVDYCVVIIASTLVYPSQDSSHVYFGYYCILWQRALHIIGARIIFVELKNLRNIYTNK